MDFTLVNIRLKQIERESGGLGPFYLLFIAALFALAFYGLYQLFLEISSGLIILFVLNILILSVHFSRSDYRFVCTKLPDAGKKMFAEYFCFSMPLIMPVLFTLNFWIIAIHLLSIFCIARFRVKPKKSGTVLPWLHRIIPVFYFEWISGIRKSWVLFLIIYLLVWSFCWLRAFPIVGLWFLMFLISTFYTEGESLNQLKIHLKGNASRFLVFKIIRHSLVLLLLFAPALFINAIFHPDLMIFHIIFMFMYLLSLAFFISSKYSMYKPAQYISGNEMVQAVGILGALIPFLAPLPLLLTLRNYFKAVKILKAFTD
jgi:hypothetical protein